MNIIEQPTLIYLEVDDNGNILDMLRGDYAVPNKQYDVFIATYDENIIKANASDMILNFDNTGVVTKVTISLKGV